MPPALLAFKVNDETVEQSEDRKNETDKPKGEMILQETKGVDVSSALEDLRASGFEMVAAFYQERVVYKKGHGLLGKHYYVVRFTFAPREFAFPQPEFAAARRRLERAFSQLVDETLWRLRIFQNPWMQEGVLISGWCHLSFNCEVRTPLTDKQGRPTKENGVEVTSKHTLRVAINA